MTPADTMRAAVEALPQRIMNLPCRVPYIGHPDAVRQWREGHRAARHAAADLVSYALSLLGSELEHPLPNEVLQLLNHIEDVVGDEAWARIDAQMWNAVTALPTQDEVREAMQASTQDTVPSWADDVLRRAPAGVPPRQYLHPSRVDALITVLEGECDGLTVTRETAEAILHYLENAPAGVTASDGSQPE